MTGYFKPTVAEGYEWLNCIDDDDYERLLCLNGQSDANSCETILVTRGPADDSQAGLRSDFPWLGSHALVFSENAVSGLRELLECSGTLLPIQTMDNETLHVIDAQIIDALCPEESIVRKIPDTDKVMFVEKEVFDADKLTGIDLFRLPFRSSPTYVSRRFVVRVRELGLVGLDFEPV